MIKYKKITIEWSYPVEIDSILQKESMKDIGIYYISSKYREKQSLLYIGKTTHSFGSRLESHKENWLDKYKGKKYVRLGRIVSPKHISEKDLKKLINDAEKTIIFCLSNFGKHELVANVVSTKSTNFDTILKIKNVGYRGQLPEELFIPKDMIIGG